MMERSSESTPAAREHRRTLAAFAKAIERAVDRAGSPAELGPMRAYRALGPTTPESGTLAPVACIVAQGTKEVVVGAERHVYGAGQLLLSSTPVPAMGRTLAASATEPCLWLSVRLDPSLVLAVVEAAPPAGATAVPRSVEASAMDLPTLRAALRLAWLHDGPADDYLVHLAMSELVYRLLASPQGPRVRQIVAQGGPPSPIALAIRWVREHYKEPLSVERLARMHHVSPSVLYLRFKQVTTMTPLQFQKELRLQEARRLIAGAGLTAAEAGAEVGYGDASHFSRDYRRFFGDSPRRHASRQLADVRADRGAEGIVTDF